MQRQTFNEKRKQKLLTQFVDGNSVDFWKVWKRNGDKNLVEVYNIFVSNLYDAKSISEGFCTKFYKNFSDPWINSDLSTRIYAVCENSKQVHNIKILTTFSRLEVMTGISKLKYRKAAGLDGLCAEHVKHAYSLLIDLIGWVE